MIVKINGTSIVEDTIRDVLQTPGSTEFLIITAAAFCSAAVNYYLTVKGGDRDKYALLKSTLNKILWVASGFVFLNLFLRNSAVIAGYFNLHIR